MSYWSVLLAFEIFLVIVCRWIRKIFCSIPLSQNSKDYLHAKGKYLLLWPFQHICSCQNCYVLCVRCHSNVVRLNWLQPRGINCLTLNFIWSTALIFWEVQPCFYSGKWLRAEAQSRIYFIWTQSILTWWQSAGNQWSIFSLYCEVLYNDPWWTLL